MTLHDPVATADDLWRRLVDHQPAVAAALALKVRALHADWPLRELGVSRPEAALDLPHSDPEDRVEIEPYDTTDWENCSACGEVQDDDCRYHKGYVTGYDALHRPLLEAILRDADVTVQVALQELAEAEEAAESEELATAEQRIKGLQV
ncbi:hypothetical protein ACODT4_44425 [Streptomyces sp. 2.9]|uniref:hypothetical protein n=1 Tax=Streptomyces tritrimontium TaxID=3406573 RepID=UPI003BB6BE7E